MGLFFIMRNDWTFKEAKQIFNLPLLELLYKAQTIHRKYFDPNKIQISMLLNIKTGNCPENCGYCSQSSHYKTDLQKEPLVDIDTLVSEAKKAKELGSTRFCMGAAWRSPLDKDLKIVCQMIEEVKKLGLETCVTLGFLKEHQIAMLKKAGLDFYNHNMNTSKAVRKFGIKLCSGGIIGLGETIDDRISMLLLLATLEEQPESVPINRFVKVAGTPLNPQSDIDPFDFVRIIALTRIFMPKSYIRLAAGREQMSDELQTLCFMGGANSIFYGGRLLTTDGPQPEQDDLLFQKIGLEKVQTICH